MGHPAQHGEAQLQGLVECVRKALPLADFIELNVSCPNVAQGRSNSTQGSASGGGAGGSGPAVSDAVTRTISAVVAARDAYASAGGGAEGRRVPILVKLKDMADADATVTAMVSLGVDGLVVLNTQNDYGALGLQLQLQPGEEAGLSAPEAEAAATGSSDRSNGSTDDSAAARRLFGADGKIVQHYTGLYGGGVSGRPMRGRSANAARAAAQAGAAAAAATEGAAGRAGPVGFTVVHVGGIEGAADVAQSRADGAQLREWYTGLMAGLAEEGPAEGLYRRTVGGAGGGLKRGDCVGGEQDGQGAGGAGGAGGQGGEGGAGGGDGDGEGAEGAEGRPLGQGQAQAQEHFQPSAAFAAKAEAVRAVAGLPQEAQLRLYGLYKQATVGDVCTPRPAGVFDAKGRAKWGAWAARAGQLRGGAEREYMELVDELVAGLAGQK
jgi:acyl-CoA-binding protein/dihydroorotate dehydrogenase